MPAAVPVAARDGGAGPEHPAGAPRPEAAGIRPRAVPPGWATGPAPPPVAAGSPAELAMPRARVGVRQPPERFPPGAAGQVRAPVRREASAPAAAAPAGPPRAAAGGPVPAAARAAQPAAARAPAARLPVAQGAVAPGPVASSRWGSESRAVPPRLGRQGRRRPVRVTPGSARGPGVDAGSGVPARTDRRSRSGRWQRPRCDRRPNAGPRRPAPAGPHHGPGAKCPTRSGWSAASRPRRTPPAGLTRARSAPATAPRSGPLARATALRVSAWAGARASSAL